MAEFDLEAASDREMDRAGPRCPVRESAVDGLQRTAGNAVTARALDGHNRTGLPDEVKVGVESLSGMALDDVRVQRNSPEPAKINAAAFTAGSTIHVGPGHERHLAHEAWHVVQQRQGRVRSTGVEGGLPVNDTDHLEREADQMGARATRIHSSALGRTRPAVRSPAQVLQKFSLPDANTPEHRLSVSGNMRRVDGQHLYVTASLIDSANDKLARVGGGAGSFVKLAPTSETDQGGLVRVVPVVVQRETGLQRNQSPRKTFLEQQSPTYQSPADCHIAAQTVMGSDDSASGSYDTERPLMGGKDRRDVSSFDPTVEAGAHIANRAKHAFFAKAMPEFVTMLQKRGLASHPRYAKVISEIANVDPATVEFGMNNQWAAVYRDHILPDPLVRTVFSSTFKVNEWAEPEVGRAFSNVNDEKQKHALQDAGQDIWNFHWAGIVLVDGKDYVSLENLSTENINEINDRWYFQMYGQGGQSFHSEALRDPHATPAAVTLGFETTSQAQHPKRELKPSLTQKMVLHWLNDPQNDNTTLADLDSCPLPYGKPLESLQAACDKLFGYSKSEVGNPSNFARIRADIRTAIQDYGLPTTPPESKKAPVALVPSGGIPPPPPPRS